MKSLLSLAVLATAALTTACSDPQDPGSPPNPDQPDAGVTALERCRSQYTTVIGKDEVCGGGFETTACKIAVDVDDSSTCFVGCIEACASPPPMAALESGTFSCTTIHNRQQNCRPAAP